jgi:hypothetical protein
MGPQHCRPFKINLISTLAVRVGPCWRGAWQRQPASQPATQSAMSNERQAARVAFRSKGWKPGWLAAAPLCSRCCHQRKRACIVGAAERSGMCCVACTFLIHFLRRHIEVSRTHSGALFIVRNCALEPGQLKVIR